MRLLVFAICVVASLASRAGESNLFARTNLVAWCIVPFDAKKRGPEERAEMMQRLGFTRFAYDWRAEHIPTFEAEIEACRKRNIDIVAWWFPGTLDKDAQTILDVLKRKSLKTQLWVTGGGAATKSPEEQIARVKAEAARIRPIAEAAATIGCKVGLYNHGGWFGEPENQLALLTELKLPNVGIVYNFHHGHEHMDRFADVMSKIKPHLLVLNINGMVKDGDRVGKKILAVGGGDREGEMLKIVEKSGWHGLIGILDHREETDSEITLRENLDGLAKLKGKGP